MPPAEVSPHRSNSDESSVVCESLLRIQGECLPEQAAEKGVI
jgi:hypothetical protein